MCKNGKLFKLERLASQWLKWDAKIFLVVQKPHRQGFEEVERLDRPYQQCERQVKPWKDLWVSVDEISHVERKAIKWVVMERKEWIFCVCTIVLSLQVWCFSSIELRLSVLCYQMKVINSFVLFYLFQNGFQIMHQESDFDDENVINP